MKKVVISTMVAVVGLLGIGLQASAGSDYPPATGTATVTPASPAPGAAFTVSFEGCEPPEDVKFSFNGTDVTSECSDDGSAGALIAAQTASAGFTAPTVPGTYTGVIVGLTSGVTATFSISIPQPELPATGADGVSTLTIISFGLLAAGVGMIAVSQVRRRRSLGS